MSPAHWFVVLIAAQRLLELAISRRNTARLLRQGGVEVGASHYPLLVLLHVAWLLALWLATSVDSVVSLPWLAAYLMLEVARIWIMTTLGRYWTTRVVHLPGVPLVRQGPYRYCRHPNYVIVAGEIAVAPMVLGEWQIAVVFSILNAAMLAWRIRIEDSALATRPQ
jgi:methyltransferase